MKRLHTKKHSGTRCAFYVVMLQTTFDNIKIFGQDAIFDNPEIP